MIRAGESLIHEAWQRANDQWRQDGTELCFVPHPATWLNQERWEDESPKSVKRERDLTIIAAHVRRPWFQRGTYDQETLLACVKADLLTADEMEAAL